MRSLPSWLSAASPARSQDLGQLAPEHREREIALAVGDVGEQAEEAPLADDLAQASNFFTPM